MVSKTPPSRQRGNTPKPTRLKIVPPHFWGKRRKPKASRTICFPFYTWLSDAASKRRSATSGSVCVTEFQEEGRLDDRYHPASLRDLSLFGESSARSGSEGLGLGIGGNPRHHAKTRPDGADRRLPQDARVADRRRHLLR